MQIGPGAFNLSGGREGAERIAHRLAELDLLSTPNDRVMTERETLATTDGNHYALLCECGA